MLLPPICFKCSYTSPHYAHHSSLWFPQVANKSFVEAWSRKQHIYSHFFFYQKQKNSQSAWYWLLFQHGDSSCGYKFYFLTRKCCFFSELGTRLKKIKTDLGGSREASWTQNKVVIQGIFSTAWEHKLQQLVRASVSSQQIRNYLKYEHALTKKKNSEQWFELERRGGCPCRPVLIDTQRSGAKWGGAPRSRPNSGE